MQKFWIWSLQQTSCDTQLAATCLFGMDSRPIFTRAIFTCRVGHTGLVFGVQSGFISRSVCARLQVCVHRLWYVPLWLTYRHTHRQTTFDQLIWKAHPAELMSHFVLVSVSIVTLIRTIKCQNRRWQDWVAVSSGWLSPQWFIVCFLQ